MGFASAGCSSPTGAVLGVFGVAEVVIDGESGFVVPPGDVEVLTAKLEELIQRPATWPEMGRAGRAHVEAHHDIDRLNDRLVEIYRGLLGAAADDPQ